MNEKSNSPWIIAFLLFGGASFTAGYFLGRSPSGAHAAVDRTDAHVSSPAETGRQRSAKTLVAEYVDAVSKWKGPFKDQAEYLSVYSKLESLKGAVLTAGPEAFGEIIQFLGRAGNVPNSAEDNLDSNGRSPRLDGEVRESLITLLPDLDAVAAATDLAKRMNDQNETGRVRAKAAGLLARLNQDVSVPALIEALDAASDRHWDGSRAIIESLGLIGTTPANREVYNQIEASLLKAFQRPTTESGMRLAIAQTLGVLRCETAIPSLELVIAHEGRDHNVRREALRSLKRISEPRAILLARDQITKEKDPAFAEFMNDFLKSFRK